jgi:hypothetical protein
MGRPGVIRALPFLGVRRRLYQALHDALGFVQVFVFGDSGMFNPALEAHPKEAVLIGLLVAGYPELDMCLCHLCGLAIGNKFAVLSALHKVTSEQARIDISNELCRHVFEQRGLSAKFGEAVGAITYCRKIRNQYAHAQWISLHDHLAFVRADNITWQKFETIPWSSTSLSVLTAQESYFEYTRKCLMWLEHQWDSLGGHLKWPEHMHRPPLQATVAPDSNQPPK